MPYFSIIIPLYNKEQFLESTLKSVFEQSFVDYEIIIVNDGSTDKSLEIAESFRNDKIKIYSQENQGVSAARNYGIEKAKASFCCFLDADDYWKPNHLESLYQLIQKFPNAGLYCNRYDIIITKNKKIKPKFDFEDTFEGYLNDFFKSSYINRVALTSATCIPKKTYNKLGGFNNEISSGQDLDYWIRIGINTKVAISNQVTLLYNFIFKNKSLSKNNIDNKTLPDLEKYEVEENLNPSLKKLLDLYRIEYALHFHINGNKNKKDYCLKNVSPENINPKTQLLFKLPSSLLRNLLFMKRYLKQFGIDFSVYH